MRNIKYFEAIREAHKQSMENDPSVMILGLGVPGPTGIFGTTSGLVDQFGADRVLDMPSSEQGMTGIALGMTVAGFRPVMVHMRVDFSTLAMDQMVNQVAKWHFMYGGKMTAPIVFRMIIGRGWGQGPQHSQSLQAWFAHIPGFKVIMPTTPYDAKGMLISAIKDQAPVVIFEHRWLYGVSGEVPESFYEVDLRKVKIMKEGNDVTIVATSYMVLEALRAADELKEIGVEAEVIDLRSIVPLDIEGIVKSVAKTNALIIADTGTVNFGISSEILARVIEIDSSLLKYQAGRIGLPFCPSPTSPSLGDAFFPRARDIVLKVGSMLDLDLSKLPPEMPPEDLWYDVPDKNFTGPY